MKSFTKHLFFLSLIGLLIVFLPAIVFSTEIKFPNAIGEVIFLQGDVHAAQPDGEDRKLDLGSQVIPLDKIITKSSSNIEIRFNDETIYAQAENSTISLDDYIYSETPSNSKLLFKMGEGTFRFVTGEIVKQNPNAFELKTPLSTIGIRGTEPFAIVSKSMERVGVLDIDPTHTVEVVSQTTSVSINRAGLMTSISSDGSMTTPSPTPADTKKDVMNSAPMTSQGELGSVNNAIDHKNRISTFKDHVNRSKGELGDLSGTSNYGQLHKISLMQNNQSTAESGAATSGGGGGGGDGGGSGSGGSGGSGGCD